MLNACELCVKIEREKEAKRILEAKKAMIKVDRFIEGYVSKFIDSLKELPEEKILFVQGKTLGQTYSGFSDLIADKTSYGNKIWRRNFLNYLDFLPFSDLEIELLINALASYGFALTVEKDKWVDFTVYSTSLQTRGHYLDIFKISINCPLEEK